MPYTYENGTLYFVPQQSVQEPPTNAPAQPPAAPPAAPPPEGWTSFIGEDGQEYWYEGQSNTVYNPATGWSSTGMVPTSMVDQSPVPQGPPAETPAGGGGGGGSTGPGYTSIAPVGTPLPPTGQPGQTFTVADAAGRAITHTWTPKGVPVTDAQGIAVSAKDGWVAGNPFVPPRETAGSQLTPEQVQAGVDADTVRAGASATSAGASVTSANASAVNAQTNAEQVKAQIAHDIATLAQAGRIADARLAYDKGVALGIIDGKETLESVIQRGNLEVNRMNAETARINSGIAAGQLMGEYQGKPTLARDIAMGRDAQGRSTLEREVQEASSRRADVATNLSRQKQEWDQFMAEREELRQLAANPVDWFSYAQRAGGIPATTGVALWDQMAQQNRNRPLGSEAFLHQQAGAGAVPPTPAPAPAAAATPVPAAAPVPAAPAAPATPPSAPVPNPGVAATQAAEAMQPATPGGMAAGRMLEANADVAEATRRGERLPMTVAGPRDTYSGPAAGRFPNVASVTASTQPTAPAPAPTAPAGGLQRTAGLPTAGDFQRLPGLPPALRAAITPGSYRGEGVSPYAIRSQGGLRNLSGQTAGALAPSARAALRPVVSQTGNWWGDRPWQR